MTLSNSSTLVAADKDSSEMARTVARKEMQVAIFSGIATRTVSAAGVVTCLNGLVNANLDSEGMDSLAKKM